MTSPPDDLPRTKADGLPTQQRVEYRWDDTSPVADLPGEQPPGDDLPGDELPIDELRDIAEVPAVEIITQMCIHLMSAAAVKCGLGIGPERQIAAEQDLDEVTASAPDLGTFHAAPLRDGLKSLQLAFREASDIPDAPGRGPGEQFTGPVV